VKNSKREIRNPKHIQMGEAQEMKRQRGAEPPHSETVAEAQAFVFLDFGIISSFDIRICLGGLEGLPAVLPL